MTRMLDSEGDDIPKDEYGNHYFDIDMYDWNKGDGPTLSMKIPAYFEGMNGIKYDGNGVLVVHIQDILNNYVSEFEQEDEGLGVPRFVEWLRDYANRLETAHAKMQP